MINIILDSSYLIQTAYENNVLDIKEYPKVYLAIVKAIQFHQDFSVVIQTDVVTQWFKIIASRYPQETFVFETIDARGALAARWGIEVPANVIHEDVPGRAAYKRPYVCTFSE